MLPGRVAARLPSRSLTLTHRVSNYLRWQTRSHSPLPTYIQSGMKSCGEGTISKVTKLQNIGSRTQDVTAASLCWGPGSKAEASNTNRHTRLLHWARQLQERRIMSHCAHVHIYCGLQCNTQQMVYLAQCVYNLHRNHSGFNFLLELLMPAGALKHSKHTELQSAARQNHSQPTHAARATFRLLNIKRCALVPV